VNLAGGQAIVAVLAQQRRQAVVRGGRRHDVPARV
jgi:hypothetical protein